MTNQYVPVLKYPGAKWKIADWIISFMPEHHTYVEPFFGSGAVFFRKPMSNIETINDIDERVVNVFRCIRDHSDELINELAMTPYARDTYEETYEVNLSKLSPVKAAVNFLNQSWQGHGFRTNEYKVGWRNDVVGREQMYAVYNYYRLPLWVAQTVDRLKQVQIDNQPALEVIKRHNDKKVLLYVDPPYPLATRAGKQYQYEMQRHDHVALLETLLDFKGLVIISSYDNDLYNSYLKEWHQEEIPALSEYGYKRKEKLYMNFQPPKQISMDELIC